MTLTHSHSNLSAYVHGHGDVELRVLGPRADIVGAIDVGHGVLCRCGVCVVWVWGRCGVGVVWV